MKEETREYKLKMMRKAVREGDNIYIFKSKDNMLKEKLCVDEPNIF